MKNYKIEPMVRAEINAVIKAYRGHSTPAETVRDLVEEYGKADARRMVATLVNAVSLHDGRIYDGVREWAQGVVSAFTNEELHELGIYGVDSYIHSAHVNQIGLTMKNYKEGAKQ